MKLPPENVGFAVKTRKDGAKPQTYKISSAAHGQRDHAHGLIFWEIHQHVWSKLGSVLEKLRKKSAPCAWSRDTMRMVTPKSENGSAQSRELWESAGAILENCHHAHGLPHHAHGPLKVGLYIPAPPSFEFIPSHPSQHLHTSKTSQNLSLSL